MPERTTKREPAILIWVAAGETPVQPDVEVGGAVTFDSLSDAVVRAQADAAGRPEKPWILISGAMFGPDQIRVLFATMPEDRPV